MMLCWDNSCLYLHGVLNCHEISISKYSFYVCFINRLPSIAANILIITLFLIKTAGICLNWSDTTSAVIKAVDLDF